MSGRGEVKSKGHTITEEKRGEGDKEKRGDRNSEGCEREGGEIGKARGKGGEAWERVSEAEIKKGKVRVCEEG